jgi:hypothetical protein
LKTVVSFFEFAEKLEFRAIGASGTYAQSNRYKFAVAGAVFINELKLVRGLATPWLSIVRMHVPLLKRRLARRMVTCLR